jgi:DNA-nicking Smr family endonuclease
METLDLHGMRHHQVKSEVENFVLLHELPVKIITGNSPAMKQIVQSVLDEYDLKGEVESYWNLGAIVVTDS